MEPLKPDDYNRYRTTPVPCDPWDPHTKVIARDMLAELAQALDGVEVELLHMGSTALEITGKNEVEVYIFPASGGWERALAILTEVYGPPGYQDTDFVRFDAKRSGYDIEIIQVRGDTGKINKAVYQMLAASPALREEYVAVKRQYCHSKREYQRHKDAFFARLVRQIPDDDDRKGTR